jgi:DNA-binding LacI/PurR family transcriptional regulator
MLGMVVTDITDPFFAQMIRGAEDAARKHGYLLTIFNTDDEFNREVEVFSLLRSRRVDGILLVLAPTKRTRPHLKSTIAAKIPVVCLARIPRGFSVDSVSIRNRENARTCVRHLIDTGHRRIGFIAGPAGVMAAEHRHLGYLDAMKERSVPVLPELIREGDFRSASGYELGKELLNGPNRPTALFVANGMMTVGLLRAMDELGLSCPDDVVLATFGDRGVADYLYPHVTVVEQPSYEVGRQGAELAIQRIRGELPANKRTHIELDAELQVKESSLRKRPRVAAS